MLTSARITEEFARAGWIDQRAARPPDQGPRRDRCAAAVAVRRATSSRSVPRFPGERLGLPQSGLPPPPTRGTAPPPRRLTNRRRDPPPETSVRVRQNRTAGKVFNRYKWPNTSPSPSPRTRSRSPATSKPSLPRPPSTGHVLRTSLPTDTLTDNDVVLRYKDLRRQLSAPSTVARCAPSHRSTVRAHMFCDAVLLPAHINTLPILSTTKPPPPPQPSQPTSTHSNPPKPPHPPHSLPLPLPPSPNQQPTTHRSPSHHPHPTPTSLPPHPLHSTHTIHHTNPSTLQPVNTQLPYGDAIGAISSP